MVGQSREIPELENRSIGLKLTHHRGRRLLAQASHQKEEADPGGESDREQRKEVEGEMELRNE